MEEAVHDHYSELITVDAAQPQEAVPVAEEDRVPWLNHEAVGKEVLTHDEELLNVLNSAGIRPEEIFQIFAREQPPRFANLISSDLDADRIDYLLRTAHHTGLPYGAVDLGYLLGQVRVDNNGQICIHPKALRTADHFLLGRYFDYQQVAFHKAVAAMEWLLKEVIKHLLSSGRLDCSTRATRERIAQGSWGSVDDPYLLGLIRDLAVNGAGTVKEMAEAILYRRPPKLLAQLEYIDPRSVGAGRSFRDRRRRVNELVGRWAEELGLPLDRWYVREGSLTMTKVGANIPISELPQLDDDETNQAIRVLNTRTGASERIMADRRSLMHVLADRALYSLRIYALIPANREAELNEIRAHVHTGLDDDEWT